MVNSLRLRKHDSRDKTMQTATIRRALMFCLILSVLVGLSSCRPEPAPSSEAASQIPAKPPPARTALIQERPGRTMVDAKSLKLQELVSQADRIFRGKVVSVTLKTVTLEQAGDKTDAQVRDVTIAVEDGMKNAKTGESVTIRQLASVSAPIKEGEEVFWFLAKDSDLGLTQPLGVFSGDFRIKDSEAGKIVNNLRGNAGLWDGSLWSGDGFSRTEVLGMAKTLKLSSARVATIEREAVQEPDNKPLSLDLLVAATKSQIKQQ